MKNKNQKTINKTNIFIGLLMGLAVLVFGGKILLEQNPLPEPQPLNQDKVDQMLEQVKKSDEGEQNFAGVWKTEDGENEFTLNEDGTVAGMEGNLKWSIEGATMTFTNSDGVTTQTFELVDGNLVDGETVYKK